MCPVDDLSASKKDSLRAKVVLIRAANVVMTLPRCKELSFLWPAEEGRGHTSLENKTDHSRMPLLPLWLIGTSKVGIEVDNRLFNEF